MGLIFPFVSRSMSAKEEGRSHSLPSQLGSPLEGLEHPLELPGELLRRAVQSQSLGRGLWDEMNPKRKLGWAFV